MKILTAKNVLITLLFLSSGYFLHRSNYYKSLYGKTKTWTPPYFCSDENLRAINFLLNSVDNPFNKARAVVALKDNGCFYDYPTLVSSAREVVNEETRIVKLVNKTDSVSVEMFKDYEKIIDNPYLDNPMTTARFDEELDKRAMKELGQLFGR